MESLHRLLIVSSLAALGLSACSMEPRQGPPAPIVQTTPRASQPARPAPAAPSTPETPAQPVKRETQVYAYQDPSAAPDPAGLPAPASTPPTSNAPDGTEPTTTAASESPAEQPAEQQVAKLDSRPTLPATEAPTPAQPVAPAAPPDPTLPPSNFATPSLPPAAASLADQAERQRQAGDFAGAAASLERSLRIAPREAYLWNRLARVRLEQGQAVQAGNLAARANDLAGDKADIKRDNWRIIAESKRRSGDLAGAGEAEQRAGL